MVFTAPCNIMLATDLTPAGDRAFDRAVQLAEQWDAALTVCHVIEASAHRPWGIERRVRNAETELGRLVRSSPSQRKLVHHIVVGDPAERTLEHAHDIGCDFLITGPAHGKVLGEKLLGSTAARMLRKAAQPVLAVRRRPEGPYGGVVVAVDFSSASAATLAGGMTFFPRASLTVVHSLHVEPDWSGPHADKSAGEIEAEAREKARTGAEQDMADLIRDVTKGKHAVATAIGEGSPEAVIGEHVDQKWPDLVITGMHGRSGQRPGGIGSVTERLLTLLHCDVLAIPQGAAG